MFRVYKGFLQKVLTILLDYRDQEIRLTDSERRVTRDWYFLQNSRYARVATYDKVKTALKFLDREHYPYDGPGDLSVDEMIDDVVGQLTSEENRDRDIIDAIVRIIGLPYARNALSGATVRLLRDAILRPDEVADLKVKLQSETFCSCCGHKFQTGEMTTLHLRDGERSLQCIRCLKPSFVAHGSNKERSVPITEVRGLGPALKRLPIDVKESSLFAKEAMHNFHIPLQPNPVAAVFPNPAEIVFIDELGGAEE